VAGCIWSDWNNPHRPFDHNRSRMSASAQAIVRKTTQGGTLGFLDDGLALTDRVSRLPLRTVDVAQGGEADGEWAGFLSHCTPQR
jgi:hypothetical protein